MGVTIAFLVVALGVTAYFNVRNRSRTLERVQRILIAHGDNSPEPATVDDALARIERRLTGPSLPDTERSLNNDRLAAALDQVPVGVILSNAEGAVVFRNRAAKPFERGRHGDALIEAVIKSRLSDATRGHATDEELRLHGPPEQVLFVVGTPLERDGQLVGAVVLVDDVSEQHRVDAVRRDFVANVSHELRTPVGAISLLAETLGGGTDPDVTERFVGRIQDEAERLSRLIDDLLDLSRIEGRAPTSPQRVVLSSVVGEATSAVREAAEHKSIVLQADEVQSSAMVRGNSADLVSAVTNLLENAVKYTPEGGQVRCQVSLDNDEVLVAVSDTGVGIPRKDLARIFERFYRVDRGRSSKSGGTGLGLSIARHVAIEHGGRVEVSSQEGVGSTFTIVLPLASAGDS